MNERLVVISKFFTDPDETAAVGTGVGEMYLPFPCTLVYVDAAPQEDDAGATVDIQDDGSDIVTALACATAATPGRWRSTHVGGSEAPVNIAAGSKITFDFNSVAAANAFSVNMWLLVDEGVPA